MHTVKLANGTSFSAEPGMTLLESANAHGVVLEYSCRTGRCGVCVAELVHGTAAVQQEELALTPAQRTAGLILTCCRSPVSDLELGIEDLPQYAAIGRKILPCRVDSITILATDIVQVVLRLPPTSPLHFLTGQYIDLIGPNAVRRSYSLAAAPRSDGRLELQIRNVPNGILSKYWFEDARANDLLRLEGPLGTFGLRKLDVENIIFLATGTGIAPVKAILEHMATEPFLWVNTKIQVLWGARVPEDFYWTPEFPELPVTFIPVLSRMAPGWTGNTGYVQDVLVAQMPDLQNSAVYACGSETMIFTARELLMGGGLPCGRFYSDAFVSSS